MVALEYGVPPEASGSITLDATLDNFDAALKLVRNELGARHCPITVQHKVDVALEELFVNVCKHAYAGQDEPGKVKIDYLYNANPHAITVSITDWGVPFDPMAEDVDEGLGLLMAKKSTDDFSYVRNEDANVVVFRNMW
jgi:anti-sigma regulatory factor (Ser/Thr protein kinase)